MPSMDRCYRCSSQRRLVRKLEDSTEYACLDCGAHEQQLNQNHLAKCFTEAQNQLASKQREPELERSPLADFKISRWLVSVGDKVRKGGDLFDGELRRKEGWKPFTRRSQRDGIIVELLVSADPTGQTILPGRTPTCSVQRIDYDAWHFVTDPEHAGGPYR